MKKLLFVFSLVTVLVVTGCSADENEDATAETETPEEQTTDDQSVQIGLLDAQSELTSDVAPYQQKINAYQAAIVDEEADEATVQAALDEAKTAAEEAASTLEGYTLDTELPEEQKAEYEEAISTLQTYYQEAQTSLDADEVDLTTAQAAWDEFQVKITSLYEANDLIAPDMASALS
ncbi:hypothetical protein [Paraliobacillus sediminis]|uniref:hypothetical protein n=1 Tax=Paraliobacillus sediminis TaxID=1885916 RepID=UPI000E3B6063|nr:hypothetical protein [Paraliobacillus sediminis]